MPSDLTERLAAKLEEDPRVWVDESIASWAAEILPLLLSEPELVAGLAPEVKRKVLAILLRERLEQMKDSDGVVRLTPADRWRVKGLMAVLAPLEAP